MASHAIGGLGLVIHGCYNQIHKGSPPIFFEPLRMMTSTLPWDA